MKYVDGYVLSVPKKNLPVYRRMAEERARFGESTALWSLENALATISKRRK
jgi:uncharacterized protein YbaA (DUF1428 family)